MLLNNEKIQLNQLDFRKVVADVRRIWKTVGSKGVVTKGAFPVFTRQTTPGEEGASKG